MMKTLRTLSVLASILLSAPLLSAAEADTPREGPPVVTAIVIKGLRKIDEQDVRKRIAMKVGSPYNASQADRDFLELWNFAVRGNNTYPFASITIRPVFVDKGVIVEYDFRERPDIAEVRWQYLDKNGKETAKHVLRPRDYEHGADLAGQSYNERKLAEAVHSIRKAYIERGFSDVSVAASTAPAAGQPEGYPEKVILTFTVTEGEPWPVKRVRFEGATAFSHNELFDALKAQQVLDIYTDGVAIDGWWHYRNEIAGFIELYYRQRGFLDATVIVREPIRERSRRGKPYLTLVLEILEGPRYRIGRVAITGNKVLQSDEILKSMNLKNYPFYSQDVEDMLRSAIRRRYGNDGRIFTSVAVDRVFREDQRVDLTFRVREDNVRKIRLMEPRGNSVTKDNVIRREFAIKPGDTYNQRLIDQTQRNLIITRYFEKVMPRQFAVGDNEIDLMFDITEGSAGQFQLAMTYSSDVGVFGTFALKYTNFDIANPRNGFRGGGQQFEVSVNSGSDFDYYSMKFMDPYFLGKPVQFDVEAYDKTETSGREWDEGRAGARIGFTKRWPLDELRQKHFMAGLTLERQDVSITNIDSTVDPLHPIRAEEGRFTLASAGINLRLDLVDNWRLPTEGWRTRIWGEIDGKATGGEREFYKYGTSLEGFIPIFKDSRGGDHTLSVKLKADWAAAYGDTPDVPVYERYYCGGLTTVRGYEYRSLGPRFPDDPTGDPVGGNFRFVGNIEYLLPLVPHHWIGVLFFDAGNVWPNAGAFDPDDIRTSIGFGFRIEPLGPLPISLFWGNALNARLGDDLETFTFMLGTFF